MKKLIIVESPSKAITIGKYLKDLGYEVTSSKGHIRDLPIKELGIDIENDFKINDVTMDGKADVIKTIQEKAKNADEIFLASDPDREGEKISQSISEILPKGKKKNMHRIMFNSVTKESILKAINNPGVINEKKCDAQRVRRILDRLVGYKISGILVSKKGPGYSAGRVQSVALRIIVEREDEIKAFIPKSWFTIFVKFNKDEIDFVSEYFGKQTEKQETLESEDEANKILKSVESQNFNVHSIKVEDKEKKSTPPFTTSKLQQEASSKLKFDTKSTMQIAQKLYEGITVKEKGTVGLITYMRTDSVRVEPKAIDDVRIHIEKEYGSQYLPAKPNEYKDKKAGNVQDAHEAIRPTDLSLTPELIRHDLTDEQYQLYKLIYNKFVASQMVNAQLEKTTVMLKCDESFFKTTGTVVKFDGFTKVFSDIEDEKNKKKGEESTEDDSNALPKLVNNEELTPVEPPKVSKQIESPPPRFTEATLVKELEHKGIGRPSTYSAIITNILAKEYVAKDKQRFFPTDKGTELCRILVKSFPREMDIKFTAKVEDSLDLIEEGTLDWLKFLKDFWPEFNNQLIKAKVEIAQTFERAPLDLSKYKTGISCKVCGIGEYMIRKGKNGEFLACSNYEVGRADSCRSTQNFKKNKRGEVSIVEKEEPKNSDKKCPLCQRPMAIKKGASGEFYACSGFYATQKCACTIPITTTHILCPTCKKGEIVEKTAKESKKTYWACSNYTSCKQVYWNETDFKKEKDEEKKDDEKK